MMRPEGPMGPGCPMRPEFPPPPPPQPLPQTLKLTFSVGPTQTPESSFTILCGTTEYQLMAGMEKKEGAGHFRIEVMGRIQPLDKSGEYLLCFHTELEFKGAGEGGVVSATGSCAVKPGDHKVLVTMGDKTLEVQVDAEK